MVPSSLRRRLFLFYRNKLLLFDQSLWIGGFRKDRFEMMNRKNKIQKVMMVWLLPIIIVMSLVQGVSAQVFLNKKVDSSEVIEEDAKLIYQMIMLRVKAVNQGDSSLFLSTIHPKYKTFYEEEKRWFEDAKQVIQPGTFQLKIKKIEREGTDQLLVKVEQSYQLKSKKRTESVVLPTIWERTNQGWRLTGLKWYSMKKGMLTVYYSHPNLKKAAQFTLDTIEEALLALRKRYGWRASHIEVKLYHLSEVFRQSVKPSLPTWAAGWHEAKQSIKFVVLQQDSIDWLKKGLVHELTHQMISELSNDNAAYWLQEGAAMYYEKHLFENRVDKKLELPKPSLMSLKELESTQLEHLPADEATRYYLSSYYWFKQMIEVNNGETHMKEVLNYLKRFPYIDQDSEKKLALTNQRTREAMRQYIHFAQYWD